MIIASVAGPWFDTGTPGVREFAAAAARYAPGTPVAGGDMIGWASAKIFELAAKATPEPLTSKALIDHLQAIHGDPLPDIAGTLLYNRNAPATPSVCIFTVVVRNKSWTSDGKRACGPYDPNL
jgi:hypothetical protein